MATLENQGRQLPHIRFRDVLGESEAYVSETGLSVWEIAWLGRAYSGDVQAIAEHTGAEASLIEEGLRYAAEHCEEIDAEIARHTERSLEELQEMFPGMQVVTVEPADTNQHRK